MDEMVGPCGKAIFRSEGSIKKLMRSRNRHGQGKGFRAGRYYCKVCLGWHITNRDKSRGSTGRSNY